jgi:predicted MPP superfamily phosphohydrolase
MVRCKVRPGCENSLPWGMALFDSLPRPLFTRRGFFKAGVGGAAGLALYSTAIARHWIDVSEHDVHLQGLPASFDGFRIAQMSDIHMDEFTEPFFLRHAIERINRMQPDLVLLTGDYVSFEITSKDFAVGSAWQCANILTRLKCSQTYSVLGNHDVSVDAAAVTAALTANGIPVLNNACVPIQRGGGRVWLAGVDDPVEGDPDPEKAIPSSIRDLPNEPIILMCHAPDYVDDLLRHPAGKAVDLMLSGHTHGGQIRLPVVGAMQLPDMGRKYVEGWFQFGRMQLYVNRGIGTVGVPFRFDCPPEISLFTLRAA